jgi:sugar lactone lactonase YvrE
MDMHIRRLQTVFHAASGDVVASYQFQTGPTFVNDVVVTREAAYFTDSQAPFLYRVALGPAGEPATDATRIPLPGTFRTNGILLDGKTLYVVQNFRNRIAVVQLSPDCLFGAVVRFITEPFTSNASTKVPTTIAEFGNALYAVTAGFAPPSPDFVVRLTK